jgi:DNA-binding beta-propeller fold protein YncE
LFIAGCETGAVGRAPYLFGLSVLAVAVAVVVVGCGGGGGFRRAAEPADSPPLRASPAGTVVKLGREPEGMAFDRRAGLLAVAVRDPSRLDFVDPRTLTVERRVSLPATARHLAPSQSGSAVLVPAEAADTLLEVSPRGGVLSAVAVGNHPHDAAAAAGAVFVADEHSDQVSVLRGGRDIAELGAPRQPGGIATAGGHYIALVAVAERILQVYDARTLGTLGSAPAGTGPTHVVALGESVYVADTEGGLVREFRVGPEPRQVATAAAPGAPYGIAVDEPRRRLWVTFTASNRLAGYALGGDSPRRIATFPTVRQPNSVEVDPRSGDVFVAGAAAGLLERISPRNGGSR